MGIQVAQYTNIHQITDKYKVLTTSKISLLHMLSSKSASYLSIPLSVTCSGLFRTVIIFCHVYLEGPFICYSLSVPLPLSTELAVRIHFPV